MFDHRHYIPVLRWKAAEKDAIKYLTEEQKSIITPLLELVPPQPRKNKTIEELTKELIANTARDIGVYWGNQAVFLDIALIDEPHRTLGLNEIITEGVNLGLKIIPVVGLNSSDQILKVASEYSKRFGICLRLTLSDLESETLVTKIEGFLSNTQLAEVNVDLMIDMKVINNNDNQKLASKIPNIAKWRTFFISGGAFPRDLTNFSVGQHLLKRTDWELWVKGISNGFVRKPSFSDYTIQHPIYYTPVPGANVSASIRYTIDEDWIIMRGQGVRTEGSSGSSQWPANAQLLSNRKEFKGGGFSFGDNYILDKGKDLNTKKTGSARTWLTAGINHHLVNVIHQLSNLRV